MSYWPPTSRLPVDLLLAGGASARGEIHLQLSGTHPGPETPLEFLARPEAFFALARAEGVAILAKRQVMVLRVAGDWLAVPPERRPLAQDVELTVTLAGGEVRRGRAVFELEPPRIRVLDFLNRADGFFPVYDEGAGVTHLVNRAHVWHVVPQD